MSKLGCNNRRVADDFRRYPDAHRMLPDNRARLPALEHQVVAPLTVRASYGRPLRTVGLKPDIRASERLTLESHASVHRRNLRPTFAAPGNQDTEMRQQSCSDSSTTWLDESKANNCGSVAYRGA